MNILYNIGGNLRILREKRKLTQEDLGREIELAELEVKKLRTAGEYLRNGENRSLRISSQTKQYRLEESAEMLLYEVNIL